MATADVSRPDAGTLTNNYMSVRALQSALSTTETNISVVTMSIETIIRDACWRHWMTPEGKEVQWNAPDFRLFLESPRPAGCQSRPDFIRRVIRGSGLEKEFEDLIRAEQGAPAGNSNAAKSPEKTNRDTITVCFPATDVIPFNPPFASTVPAAQSTPARRTSRPRSRNYRREAPTGTSVSYTLRRLQKQAPELAAEVMRGGLTPHAAAVRAGLHEVKLTIPRDHPVRAARIILRHLSPGQLAELVTELSRAAGRE